MNEKRLQEIKERLEAAKPDDGFDYPSSILGSVENLCTAVVYENATGQRDFIADVFPSYMRSDVRGDEFIRITAKRHYYRLKFLENVFADMQWLINNLE